MTNDNKKPKPAKKTNKHKAKKLKVHVTYLEMNAPPLRSIPVPTRPRIALLQAENIPTDFYNYLYKTVGKPHHWEKHRNLAAAKLDAIINADNIEISILYADGCPAGFFELNTENKPHEIEIRYVGMSPDYHGMGIGKWFIAAAISAAWAHKPDRVILETNTIDHPAALRIYQRLGFSPYATGDDEITPWQ